MQGTTITDAELFAALGGVKDEGGVWTVSGNIHTYTVTATSPCSDEATATVTVIEQAKPNAGTDGTLTVCAGTSPSDAELFEALSGVKDEGGVWTVSGNVHTYRVSATSHHVQKQQCHSHSNRTS